MSRAPVKARSVAGSVQVGTMSEAEEVERLKKDLDKCNSIIKVSAGAVVSTHDTPRSDEPGARIEAGPPRAQYAPDTDYNT